MVCRMKTTVDITDSLLAEAKRRAAEHGTSLRSLIEEGLRAVLGQPSHADFRLQDASVDGEGLSSEFAGRSWDAVRDAIYAGRGA